MDTGPLRLCYHVVRAPVTERLEGIWRIGNTTIGGHTIEIASPTCCGRLVSIYMHISFVRTVLSGGYGITQRICCFTCACNASGASPHCKYPLIQAIFHPALLI